MKNLFLLCILFTGCIKAPTFEQVKSHTVLCLKEPGETCEVQEWPGDELHPEEIHSGAVQTIHVCDPTLWVNFVARSK